jgi:hypothetical protein
MANRAWAGLIVLLLVRISSAQELPVFDFKNAKTAEEWKGNPDVAGTKVTDEGLVISINGRDPWIIGPARDLPLQPLWLRMRVWSEVGGELQVFYYTKGSSEKDSVKADVPALVWTDVRVLLPPLGPGYRLRIDPPGQKGKAILQRVEFEKREVLVAPKWPKPVAGKLEDPLEVKAFDLTLRHSRTRLGEFEIWMHDKRMAIGGGWGEIGYMVDGKQRWLDLSKAEVKAHAVEEGKSISIRATISDADGAKWQIDERFVKAERTGIEVHVAIWADKDREVIFLPVFFMFPGVGTFGEKTFAAIFPGLEYLDEDEPSSSQKDIEGPGSRRQVPYTSKITMPMMGIANDLLYVGLIWKATDSICAVFDSPDRLFKSGGHVMGVIFPGSDPRVREESNLLPFRPAKLAAGNPVMLNGTLIGGISTDVSLAVGEWLSHNKLPAVSQVDNPDDYVKLTTAGWLDSKINEGGLFRHAYPGEFNAHPAGDAVAMIDWLAARTDDRPLEARLREAHKLARSRLTPGAVYSSVGHIKTPAAALLYGDANEAAARAKQQGRELLKRFDEKGRVIYDPRGGPDLARTHQFGHANGLTANVVVSVLEAATLSGDPELLKAGLERLRQLDRYPDPVPRGAQTWEIPLHTPDILAAAHLVRAFTLGYQLSGDERLAGSALRWAEAGLPFVYLRDPTEGQIGRYATIAVLGATHWKAPNWMGQPVQWCGLVYADALYQMAACLQPRLKMDQWIQIADGITASGIQQTWPVGSDLERQGLLPDSFKLQSQQRLDVCINPATLQVVAARFYRQPPVYSFYVMKGLYVHVPGEVVKTETEKEALWVRVRPCVKGPYSVLICGLKKEPRVTVNAAPAEKDAVKYVGDGGRLIIKLDGESSVLLEDLN